MARKVILDVDPGIDGAVALCLALFDPRLDVIAVTATAGNVGPQQASRNVQAIIEQLDPPRWPRIGAASNEVAMPVDGRHLHGNDGLGNAEFNVAELHHRHPSEKVICDEVRAAPDEVTILCLGPLTNLAAAMGRDPELPAQIGQVVMMGGTYTGSGDVTAAAEFNIYCHPPAARTVFLSPVTKTLVPLDVSRTLKMTYDQYDQLPDESTKIGKFLRRILPCAFRTHHQRLGQESIQLQDVVAVIAMLQPELFETKLVYGDVEVAGELTTGATILDRRRTSDAQPNMEVVVSIDTTAVIDCLMRGLAKSA